MTHRFQIQHKGRVHRRAGHMGQYAYNEKISIVPEGHRPHHAMCTGGSRRRHTGTCAGNVRRGALSSCLHSLVLTCSITCNALHDVGTRGRPTWGGEGVCRTRPQGCQSNCKYQAANRAGRNLGNTATRPHVHSTNRALAPLEAFRGMQRGTFDIYQDSRAPQDG